MDYQLNTIRALGAAAAISAALISGTAQAANTSSSLSVTATVSSTCSASTTPVAFGSVDVTGGNHDAEGKVSVTCTNGTGWAAAAGAGAGSGATVAARKMTAGSNTLNYLLYRDSSRTSLWGDGTSSTATVTNTGSGAAQEFTVYGRIPTGQATAAVGSYSDTVSVTITY